MGGGKETPRQKMVGLMYLVLMALLAMNVSKEVINAFVTLNDKIESGNLIIKGTMEGAYGSFEQAIAGLTATKASPEEIENVKKIQAQALQIKGWSKSLTNYFVEQSSTLIKESGDASFGMVDELSPAGDKHYRVDDDGYFHLFGLMHLSKKDDYDVATRLYIGDGGFENPKGTFLVDSITGFRDRICILIANYKDDKGTYTFTPPQIRPEMENDPVSTKTFNDELKKALSTVNPLDTALISQIYGILSPPVNTMNHGLKYPWIGKQFDHAPLVAAIAMFTSIRADLLQAENKAVNHIASRVVAPKFNFNKIEPLAFAPASYINQGDSIKMKVMIAAYDSTESMKLKYWVDDSTMSGDGLAYEAPAGSQLKLQGGSVGDHTIYGTIAVKEKGVEKQKPWSFKYSVGAPNAAVSAYDLNVLYSNWDNRIKVAAGGFDPSLVTVNCSGCTSFSKSGDFYVAKVQGMKGEATISVSAKTPDGKSVSLASEKFRIFGLPKPEPKFAGQGFEKSTMSIAQAKQCLPIKAVMEGPLNVPFEIAGFKMVVTKNGKVAELKSNDGNFTSDMKSAVQAMAKGTVLTLTEIKARKIGSSATVTIGSLSFVLQ
jgi:gliding motility-associated protein GldM